MTSGRVWAGVAGALRSEVGVRPAISGSCPDVLWCGSGTTVGPEAPARKATVQRRGRAGGAI